MQQRVLLVGVDGQMVVTALAGIDEFQIDFLPDPFDVTIAPVLERESGGVATSFFYGTLVRTTRRVSVDLVRRAVGNVDAAAICPPPRNAGGKMLIGVGDTPVVLFFVLVLRGVRSGVATQPELFDEGIAFFVIRQLLE